MFTFPDSHIDMLIHCFNCPKAHSLYSSGGTYLHNTSLTTCQFILHFLHRNLVITTLVQPCMYHCTVHSRLQHIASTYSQLCMHHTNIATITFHTFFKNRVPNGKLKVHYFQICHARTLKGRPQYFWPICLGLQRVNSSVQNWAKFGF